ncbi:hypothetical protein ACOACO_12720 [Nocardioides sp. CPCC 205120]|uniref:hypothetical protein n=1 Tax=Nocardioides sp. CPCC 205120 TaxID=3406462 RepID=UPI003B502230
MRASRWVATWSDDGRSVTYHPREAREREPRPFGEWARSPHGDVTDRRAFEAHMDTVGEDDQSLPDADT